MTKQIRPIDVKGLEEEYLTVSPDDDDRMIALKEAVRVLNPIDKTILMMYINMASMRKVAKILGVSLSTTHNKIKEIQNKLKCTLT